MRVQELLDAKQRETITAAVSTPVTDAMGLFIENQISCLPVTGEAGELVGIISDKDIFRAIFGNRKDVQKFTVGDLMTTNLIIGVPDDDITYIGNLMTKNHVRHIPIMEKQKMIGLVSERDIVKAQAEHIAIENRYLKMYIDGPHNP